MCDFIGMFHPLLSFGGSALRVVDHARGGFAFKYLRSILSWGVGFVFFPLLYSISDSAIFY